MSSVDSFAPDVEATRPRRIRSLRTSVDQPPRRLDRPTARSANPERDKLSVYIPIQGLKKLTVASALWDKDKSDIVAEVLAEKRSGVTFHDRTPTRTPAQSLTVTEIGGDPTARGGESASLPRTVAGRAGHAATPERTGRCARGRPRQQGRAGGSMGCCPGPRANSSSR